MSLIQRNIELLVNKPEFLNFLVVYYIVRRKSNKSNLFSLKSLMSKEDILYEIGRTFVVVFTDLEQASNPSIWSLLNPRKERFLNTICNAAYSNQYSLIKKYKGEEIGEPSGTPDPDKESHPYYVEVIKRDFGAFLRYYLSSKPLRSSKFIAKMKGFIYKKYMESLLEETEEWRLLQEYSMNMEPLSNLKRLFIINESKKIQNREFSDSDDEIF